ncbi:MAG: response regulator [Anaerolineae bacterium]|nr:response regulator [Anaerolineae bacterium]
MITFEEFAAVLPDALNHLFDPGYQPLPIMYTLVGKNPQQGVEVIQNVVLRAIETLKPSPQVPTSTRGWRIYEVLSLRYVQNLTQEATAERLGITPRHLRREQQQAVNALALHLWRASPASGGSPVTALTDDDQMAPAAPAVEGEDEWYAQVQQEIAALRKSAPASSAEVGETMRAVTDLTQALAAKHGVVTRLGSVEPDMHAAIHPSVLRQILVVGITGLMQQVTPGGEIGLSASQVEGRIHVTITGSPASAGVPLPDYLTEQVLAVEGGSVRSYMEGDAASFHLDLPVASTVTVLVVDDNADLVHFYRRYTQGTRYRIITAEGEDLFETVVRTKPDLVVLDVMLPGVDGWELLVHLREHPDTRSLPVIVCSVVRQPELALALGAALYIPKPVRRQEFLKALDSLVSQAVGEAQKVGTNSGPPG